MIGKIETAGKLVDLSPNKAYRRYAQICLGDPGVEHGYQGRVREAHC